MSYSYSPELKAPQKMPDIDPGKAAMAGMLKILCLTHQKQTAAFRPPEGLACRKISVQAADGAQIPCFVVEPESSDDPRVFLPEYRLVPQFTAPTQLNDCMAVWLELQRHAVDPSRLLVIGDSAGAALTAGLCIGLRGRACHADACWSPKATKAMWDAYLKGADESLLPCLVPARCEDLSGLPPAYIEPQEIDVLHDEAVALASALQKGGVSVELNEIVGSYHGFDSDLSSPLVRRVIAQRIEAAKKILT